MDHPDDIPQVPNEIPFYGSPAISLLPRAEIREQTKDSVPPLFGTLFRKAAGVRKVTISDGTLVERHYRKTDASDDETIEHPVTNIWDGTLLREHAITTGQVIGVAWTADERGFVDPSTVLITAKDHSARMGTPNAPPVGPDDGSPGSYFHVLYRLLGSPPNDYLEQWAGGSNVTYTHGAQPFKMTAGSTGADIFRKFNPVLGQYEYRGVKGISPVSATAIGDNVEVSLDSGINHDMTVRFLKLEIGSPTSVPIDLPSLVVTGTTDSAGAHTHDISDHTHPLDAHHHAQYGGGQTGDGIVGTSDDFLSTGSGGSGTTDSDGAHTHTVSGTTAALTSDSPTTRPTVSIPGAPSVVVDTDAGYLVYCYRSGLLYGVYQSGVSGSTLPAVAGKPALPVDGTTSEYCVWKTPT